jgi:serine/threonine protein kinase
MEDMDRTMPPKPRQEVIVDDATMPGKRDRKVDGRFEVGDLIMRRYKVLAELGQGGMGVVYRCFDETAGIEVALKALPPELSHNTLEMEDIKDNFQLVSKLVHQNIAISKQLEKDNSNGNYYLIMECCDGEDLRRWIRRKRQDGGLKIEPI